MVDKYRILNKLGAGGMGEVYLAEDTSLGNRLIALKAMMIPQGQRSTQELNVATDAFRREVLMLAQLHHPHLPRIYEHFYAQGRWFLVMDYVRGQTLEERIQSSPLTIPQAIQIGIQLCEVLSYLHGQHPPVVFRDLKPANIMIENQHLYLIDFGIARLFQPDLGQDTVALGSPGFAPLEQYQGRTTPKSDLYALGATLHYLLSGRHPATSPFQFASLPATVDQQLQALVNRLLASEDQRPDNARVVQQELKSLVAPAATSVVPVAPAPSVSVAASIPSSVLGRIIPVLCVGVGQMEEIRWYELASLPLDIKVTLLQMQRIWGLQFVFQTALSGDVMEQQVARQLQEAQIMICVLSRIFLASEACYALLEKMLEEKERVPTKKAFFFAQEAVDLGGISINPKVVLPVEGNSELVVKSLRLAIIRLLAGHEKVLGKEMTLLAWLLLILELAPQLDYWPQTNLFRTPMGSWVRDLGWQGIDKRGFVTNRGAHFIVKQLRDPAVAELSCALAGESDPAKIVGTSDKF